jgi:hypothetical protein
MENTENTESMTTPDPAPPPGPNLGRVHASTMDSVNLINSLLSGTASPESESIIARNLAHIYVVLGRHAWSEAEAAPLFACLADAVAVYPGLGSESAILARLAESAVLVD